MIPDIWLALYNLLNGFFSIILSGKQPREIIRTTASEEAEAQRIQLFL